MNDERWTIVDRLLDGALAREPLERATFLDDACGNDEALRREVESLLAHEREAAGFMSTPAGAPAAGSMSNGTSMIGRQLGPYAIQAPLGAGGMGEVYRARDTKLGRDVAIKILPRLFTTDPERRARFDREARLLASLNHPHIGAIYGLEDMDGAAALILELVDGDTLAERLAKGPIPIGEALQISRQIADALEAAHEKGIIHRDLKPANIKITPDGVVKVLDFGLAKAASADASGLDLTDSPTVTIGGTRDGVILGTAAYMSPEQARGKPLDKRADIWAFGCVLYEMLTGRSPFARDTITDTLAAIVERDPDWQVLPSATPDGVCGLLRRCLQKDPQRRLRDIGDARLDIDDATAAPTARSIGATAVRNTRERLFSVAVLIGAVAVGAAGMSRYTSGRAVQANEVRLEINVPPTIEPTSLAISPDGKTLVFVATSDGKSRLWLRPLDAVSTRPLAGTDDAKYPFWSPDSSSIGFFSDARLKRVDVDSGSVQPLVETLNPQGGVWNRDGTILYTPFQTAPVFRISEVGGQPTSVTQVNQQTANYRFPQLLPDGRQFLFHAIGTAPGIYVGRPGGSNPQWIVDAEAATYTSSGYLLFVRQGTLFAQKFDAVRLALAGSPAAIAEHVVVGPPGSAALSASAAGPIVYRTGPPGTRRLVWFNRSGKELARVAGSDITNGSSSSLSPDGRRVVLERTASGSADLWLLDLERGVPSRFTFDTSFDVFPIWSPDSRRIAFSSDRKGSFDLYVKSAAGTGSEDFLLGGDGSQIPQDWSPDGRILLYASYVANNRDILALPLNGDQKPFPVAQTAFAETDGQFSPDGHWVAYQSNESGPIEIYVQPFPGPGAKTQISAGGGVQVRWRQDGQELFYLGPDNRLMAVKIRLDSQGKTVEVGHPVSLFTAHLSGSPQGGLSRHYMVPGDGQRFLIDTMAEVTLPITVILNWKPKP